MNTKLYHALRYFVLSGLFIITGGSVYGQVDETSELYKNMWKNDSLLFSVGFNQCDITQFESLISENCEFYHDISGSVKSKDDFISSIRDGLCKMENKYKAIRKLDVTSMEVYPLMNNGILYGAVQNGIHRFYEIEIEIEKGKEEYLRSVAKFTHLWILEDDIWQLQRMISYDHQTTDTE